MAHPPENNRLARLQEELCRAKSEKAKQYLRMHIANEEHYQDSLQDLAELLLEIWMERKDRG
jgi:hypothetical protein